MDLTDVIGIAGVAVAAVGLFLVFWQLRSQVSIASADLAVRLDERLGSFTGIYGRLFEGGEWYDSPIDDDSVLEIEHYLTFYDTLQQLAEQRLFSVEQINRMFGFRFLMTMHNPAIKVILAKRPGCWQDLAFLYNAIISLRHLRGASIPRPDQKWDRGFLETLSQ